MNIIPAENFDLIDHSIHPNRKLNSIRFWEKVDKSNIDGCWTWKGYTLGKGYGRFRIGNKRYGAHRVSWMLINGNIPNGMCVCHKCDNPSCVNPDHLFLGNQKDNVLDSWKKGRSKPRRGALAGSAKLTEKQAYAIKERARNGESQKLLAVEFGICQNTVNRIKNGKRWECLDK